VIGGGVYFAAKEQPAEPPAVRRKEQPHMSYEQFDASRLEVQPLAKRKSLLRIEDIAADPSQPAPEAGPWREKIDALAGRIVAARGSGAAVMLAYGAHLIKNGAGPLVGALIEGGAVTHVATQGAGIIHDWEFAFQGASSESVRENAPLGRFGTWSETGRWINLAVTAGAAEGMGFGEGMGRLIAEDGLSLPEKEALVEQIRANPSDELTAARADLLCMMERFNLSAGRHDVDHPYKRYSVTACAYSHRVPMTVHPGIGYDIYTNHPMFVGGGIGRAAITDARIFARSVMDLSGGVYLSIGSAIMSPQVFEKAFSCANNVLRQEGAGIEGHYIGVVDIQEGGNWDWTSGEPPKEHPAYYLRFCKSFHRMGGQVDYFCVDNRVFLSALVESLRERG